MDRSMKLLIVEHDLFDIDLLRYELSKAFPNHEAEVVQTEQEFIAALAHRPHIILSDYSLPSFDGARAFEIKQKLAPEIPFILVSGTIGEEKAVELIKNGVTDYALKDKLYALAPKIVRALNEAEERQRKRSIEEALLKSEANLRAMFDSTDVGFLFLNPDGTVLAFNPMSQHWAQYSFGVELKVNMNFKDLLIKDRLMPFSVLAGRVMAGNEVSYETNYPKADGTVSWFYIHAKPVTGEDKTVIGICIAVSDITASKQAEEEIKKLNTGLEERVKERTTELMEANTALEAFSYSVSHDLRSPVRSVMGFAQIINKEHGHALNAELKELFTHIESSSKRMNAIIDDLLALAKCGKDKLHKTNVNMHNLFYGVWDNLLFSTAHKATLKMQEMPVVYADSSMLEQVVVNLLSNAIKYSSKKEKPEITVGCEEGAESYTFFVKDNGAGFDMKNYNRLFNAFQRLHSIGDFEGTGIGLTLIKRIVEKHGGEVWAEGVVGEGASFYFTLPKLTGRLIKGGKNNLSSSAEPGQHA